ncbi:MAG: adenine deaminase [Ruminococcaceae bacterium]|nr:adenine deaminase [Oscillospiraceae bacterium]
MVESREVKTARRLARKEKLVAVAAGREPADLVFKNATYVNVFCSTLDRGDVAVSDRLIAGMGGPYHGRVEIDMTGKLLLPGFFDAHIHLESSMVRPAEFARAVLPHGTTTVVTDPHEIANVLGVHGIEYMLQATEGLPMDVRFMLPSCVPATPWDESGAVLDADALRPLYGRKHVEGLAEMMDFVSVANGDPAVLRKIVDAQNEHRRIDGHAPGLSGYDLSAYIAAGVYSDHECSDLEGALARLSRGQYIMIREGTAARNLDALADLLKGPTHTYCMFCTDDKHPSDLLELGHIDYILKRAIALGVDPIIAVKCASHHAARYFKLNNRGAVAPGFLADLLVVDDFDHFTIEQVYRKGVLVCDHGEVLPFDEPQPAEYLARHAHDTVHVRRLSAADFACAGPLGVVEMVPGEIVSADGGKADHIDLGTDTLKIAVIERHGGSGNIGLGYLRGYGLKSGAVAATVAHDSHNLIVVGADEQSMADAANRCAEMGGGLLVMEGGRSRAEVALPIAGLMSELPLRALNEQLESAKEVAFGLGVNRGIDPFMTLSFMALPVIPTLRVTTRGVFDVSRQAYV